MTTPYPLDEVPVPAEPPMTWRASAEARVAKTVGLIILSAVPALYLWFTLWTNNVRNAGWDVLACALLAWAWLAWRTWTQCVTLTRDTLVIRNVFQTERVALVDITAVAFRGGMLTVTEARPPSRLTGTVPVKAPVMPDGPQGGTGERYKIGALARGNGYSSGRPYRADDVADVIAVAAGLPPLARRKPVTGRRASVSGIPIALAFVVLGAVMPHTHGGLRDAVFGASLTVLGFWCFWPSVLAAYDRHDRRGRSSRRRNRPR